MVSNEVKGLESLQVWQKAMDLAIKVCKELLPTLPVEEKYALTDQLRRSVQSIPSNIAEGFGRYYYQEGVRFCYIARGSLNETLSHLYLAQRMGYIVESEYERYTKAIDAINRMLSGYVAFLKKANVARQNILIPRMKIFRTTLSKIPNIPGRISPECLGAKVAELLN